MKFAPTRHGCCSYHAWAWASVQRACALAFTGQAERIAAAQSRITGRENIRKRMSPPSLHEKE
jgi:hypothetical protein